MRHSGKPGCIPCRLASTLSKPEIKALRLAIPRVLKRGLKNLGTSLGTGKTNFYSVASRQGRNKDELNVFRRTDLPCPRCKANHGAHYCGSEKYAYMSEVSKNLAGFLNLRIEQSICQQGNLGGAGVGCQVSGLSGSSYNGKEDQV